MYHVWDEFPVEVKEQVADRTYVRRPTDAEDHFLTRDEEGYCPLGRALQLTGKIGPDASFFHRTPTPTLFLHLQYRGTEVPTSRYHTMYRLAWRFIHDLDRGKIKDLRQALGLPIQ